MVTFAPDLPDKDPQEWLNSAKATPAAESNKSLEFLSKGFEGVSEGILQGDKLASAYVKENVSAGASKILEEENKKLESLIPESNLPAELRGQAYDKASMIQEAQRANGSISPTHFLATLDRYAKDESARYNYLPHMQEAVRKGIAEATGVSHTANELRESLMKDLNSFLTNKDKQTEKVYNELWNYRGAPGFSGMEKALRNKEDGAVDRAVDFMQKESSRDYQIKKDNEEMNNAKLTREQREHFAQDSFLSWGGGFVNDHLHSVIQDGFGIKTDQGIIDRFRAASEGRREMSDQEAQQLGAVLKAHGAQVQARLIQLANQPYVNPKTGKVEGTWGSVLGPQLNDHVEKLMAPYRIAENWVKDHELGPLSAVTRWNTAFSNDTQMAVHKSEVGVPIAALDALKKSGAPEFYTNLVQNQFKQGLTDKLTGLTSSLQARATMTEQQLRDNQLPGGNGSLQKDFDTLKKVGVRDPKIWNNFVDNVTNITNPKMLPDPKMRAALAFHTFNPENLNVIRTWADQDQQGVYETMASPKMSQAIKELDAQFPGLYDHYKSWGTQTFKTIAQREILDLNRFQKTEQDNLHYDDTTQQFTYDRGEGRFKNAFVDRTVGRLNRAIRVIREIAKSENTDPSHVNSYVYETMRSFGYDEPGAPEGYNKGMLKAMQATAAEAKRAREETLNSMKERTLNKKKKEE